MTWYNWNKGHITIAHNSGLSFLVYSDFHYKIRMLWDHLVFFMGSHCPASRTTLVATRFWVVMICPIIKCLTVLEFSFILFDLCLFITIFNFILNYVPIVTFWIFTYHKIWILLIIFCFIWSYWIVWKCFGVLWVNWCQFAVALANKVKIGLAF